MTPRTAASTAGTLLLFAVVGVACFAAGAVYLADFDDSDARTPVAALSAGILAFSFVIGLVLAVVRRSASQVCFALLVGLVVAALPWLTLV